MTTHLLDGCRTEPLGSYLQALGAWRAVVRLLDPSARGRWSAGRFVLETDVLDLEGELLRAFTPVPIVSPWNSGSGFAGNGKSQAAEQLLQRVRDSEDRRFAHLRDAVLAADRVVAEGRRRGWQGKGDEFWDKSVKNHVIALSRNMLPDDALPWLDAAVVLGQDADPAFSRLLGTGGNFGRLDLSATYMQRAFAVLVDRKTAALSDDWLRAALRGDESVPYLRDTVGQFDPGRAGGVQSSPLEKGDEKGFANPWSQLLALEGAVLFASAAVRRHGSQNVRAALPFMVQGSATGFNSSATGEKVLGELWTPEWAASASLREVEQLLGEGRADWGGRPARSGLDFVRAVTALGVDRGIDRFTRQLFVERHGQSPLAVAAGRIEVKARPRVGLLAELDPWFQAVMRAGPTGLAATRMRQLERAMFVVAREDSPATWHALVIELGRLHVTVERSGALRKVVPPVRLRDGKQWLEALDPNGSAELRLAVALAAGRDVVSESGSGLRHLLSAAQLSRTGQLEWSNAATPVSSAAGLASALAHAHRLRALPGRVPDPLAGDAAQPAVRGVFSAFRHGFAAPLTDGVLLALGSLDERLLLDLLTGLLLVGLPVHAHLTSSEAPVLLPPLFALLVPFYGRAPLLLPATDGEGPGTWTSLRPGSSWLGWLRSGQFEQVSTDARHRLRAAGVRHAISASGTARTELDGERIAAALLLPFTSTDRVVALRAVADLSPERPPVSLTTTSGANS